MNIIRNLTDFEVHRGQLPNLALVKDNPLHLNTPGTVPEGITQSGSGTFADMLIKSLEKTSNQIVDSQLLQQQAIVSPDSVNPTDLSVSMMKGYMSINLTKAVLDRALAAYKELTTVR